LFGKVNAKFLENIHIEFGANKEGRGILCPQPPFTEWCLPLFANLVHNSTYERGELGMV